MTDNQISSSLKELQTGDQWMVWERPVREHKELNREIWEYTQRDG